MILRPAGDWYYNHGRIDWAHDDLPGNPSSNWGGGSKPVNANLLFKDGHVKLYPYEDLEDVGEPNGADSGSRQFSLLPQ